MKKQFAMTTAMAASLAALSGCSSNDWDDGQVYTNYDTTVCVDRDGRRVYDDWCEDDRYYAGSGGGSGGYYRYYIGRNGAVPYYGDSIRERGIAGSYQPRAGATYYPSPVDSRVTRSQAISRGGLGSSGRFFGSGRS
jgi:hypothetical protein